jgi:hypothetical protein
MTPEAEVTDMAEAVEAESRSAPPRPSVDDLVSRCRAACHARADSQAAEDAAAKAHAAARTASAKASLAVTECKQALMRLVEGE